LKEIKLHLILFYFAAKKSACFDLFNLMIILKISIHSLLLIVVI